MSISCIFLLVGAAIKSFVDEENTELHSVIVNAKIIDDQRYNSNSEFKVRFKYNGVYYSNVLQASGHIFKLNDSTDIRIDSRNPLQYCEFAN